MSNRIDASRVGALLLAGAALASGEAGEETLAETVIVANRLATPAEDLGSAFSALEVELLERRGVVVLEDALRLVPGTGVGSEGGQRGSISALRMRGTEADHTLVLIDGMRVTDANVTPFNLLGGESLVGLSSIGVLRGPQSSLYGSEAIGGVVALETKRGRAGGRQMIVAEGGSFGSVRATGEFQGDLDGVRWFLGGGHEQTDNDRSFNDYERQTAALRVEGDLGTATTVGMTARFWNSEYENPGGTDFPSRAVDEREAWLVTTYAEHEFNAMLQSKLVLGFYGEEFEESGDFPFGSEARKASLDLRNVVRWNDAHNTVVGGVAEWMSFESTATPVDEDAWQTGLYANHVWRPIEQLTLALGGRWEYFDRWDDVFTWRATASWRTPVEGVRLHGSYGTGFRAPSFFELYGAIPAFGFFGDPTLDAEYSRGWDAGIEWRLTDDVRIDVTWFHNRIEDLIDFTPANIGEATTRGIEIEASGELLDGKLAWRGAYTWLEANDEDTGLRLARRARHAAAFDVRAEPAPRWLVGVGGTYVNGVIDNDFSVFPAVRKPLDDYLLLRLYGRYELSENLALHARVENLLDEDYEEIANFPGRGAGVFGGVEVSW